MKIAICIIATNNYKGFIPLLTKSICEYFLINHQIELHIFADEGEIEIYEDERVKPFVYKIPSYKFPYASLYRYAIMTKVDYDTDYIFYLDADMCIVDFVGDEILGDIVAVRHPGYFRGGGSWETNRRSSAYIPIEKRIKYYCGGFNGGETETFVKAMEMMRDIIEYDEKRGVMAIWQDESHLNKLFADMPELLHELDPSYCMPEPMHKRIDWGINNFKPKILALEKQKNFRL